jgi:peptidoglycan/xylan/chitin deacetylase (PgdA/CDA1 family)
MKTLIANFLYIFGLSRLAFLLSRLFYGNHIRVLHYHGTSFPYMSTFDQQLRFYSKYYQNINYNDLNRFFSSGGSFLKKPGLIISFDDGLRSNYENAIPLLEKYGFTAWLMVPRGPIDFNLVDQKNYVGKYYDIDSLQFPDGRLVMNWEEIKKASKNHVIGCHTYSHHRMKLDDDFFILNHEIYQSKKELETNLGRYVTIFCWVGGEESHYTKFAAKKIKDTGYVYSFMTNSIPITAATSPFQINRTNVEANYPLPLVLFQLSGLMDLFYYFKFKRVNRITGVN